MITIDRTAAPEIKQIEDIKIVEAEKKLLSNNIPFYTINAGTEDLVRIEWMFNAGNRYESKHLLSVATNRLLREGTKSFSSKEISEKIDFYGATLQVKPEPDYVTIILYCLNKYLDDMIPLVREIITEPAFPQKELDIYVQNSIQNLSVNDSRVEYVAKNKMDEAIFGPEHPYGHYPKPEDYQSLTIEALKDFHQNYYFAENCNIIAAGKIPADLFQAINKHFGSKDWSREAPVAKAEKVIMPFEQHKIHEPWEGALQSAIRIGKILFNKTHPDYFGTNVLSTIFGGYFGSRLMSNIREDKGYTYGIYSVVISLIDSGYFFIGTEVGVDVCKKAIEEIYKEIRKLKTETVNEKELSLVRNYMLGHFLSGIDGPFALADRLKGILPYGLSYDYYYKFIETVKFIKPLEIKELANKYFDEEEMYEVVVG